MDIWENVLLIDLFFSRIVGQSSSSCCWNAGCLFWHQAASLVALFFFCAFVVKRRMTKQSAGESVLLSCLSGFPLSPAFSREGDLDKNVDYYCNRYCC